MIGVLSGIRVLDISQLIAGPLAASLLGDLGANVIKVEPPDGDKGRMLGPALLDAERSTTFVAVNRNKRGIVLDAKNSAGREVITRLIAAADVVISSYRTSTAARLGLDRRDLEAINPDLISCSITGFGDDGPLSDEPAVDYALQARSGLLTISGFEDTPVRIAITVVDLACAQTAVQGILAALFHRQRSGVSQHIRVSLYDTALALQVAPLTGYLHTGQQPVRTGNSAALGAPADLFPTADGYIVVSAYFPKQWVSLCELLARRDLIDDDRFKSNERRLQHRAELFSVLASHFRGRSTDEWLEALRPLGIVASPVCDYESVVNAAQTRINEMIVEWPDPHTGSIRGLGSPLRMSVTPPSIERSAPRLGEHAAEVLRELDVADEEIDAWGRRGAFGPLWQRAAATSEWQEEL